MKKEKEDAKEEQERKRRALAVGEKLLPLLDEVWGLDHPRCALLRTKLGALYQRFGDPDQADSMRSAALASRLKTLGENHSDTLQSLKAQASWYLHRDDFDRAEQGYVQTYRIQKSLREKEKNPFNIVDNLTESMMKGVGFLTGKNSISGLLERMVNSPAYFLGEIADQAIKKGEFAKAIRVKQMVIPLTVEQHGADHWSVVDARLSLADTQRLSQMSPQQREALDRAEVLFREAMDPKQPLSQRLDKAQAALAIRQELLGDHHRLCAQTLAHLGQTYRSLGEYERAETCLLEAVAIDRKTLGARHIQTALDQFYLGIFYQGRRSFLRAEPLYRLALATYAKEPWWDKSGFSNYFKSHLHLAQIDHDMGAFAKAEPHYVEALAIEKKSDRKDLLYSARLQDLAAFYLDWHKPALGMPYAQEAAALNRKRTEMYATGETKNFVPWAGQSELQQLATTRQHRLFLDQYLSLAEAADLQGAAAGYEELLAWKGSVSARQHAMRVSYRAAVASGSPAAKAFANLQEATRRLAALSNIQVASQMDADKLQVELKTWTNRVHTLEEDLAKMSRGFKAHLHQRDRTPLDLQRALPADAVLFDFIKYNRHQPRADGLGKGSARPWLAAYVIRREGTITWVDLGPALDMEKVVDAWRMANWSLKAGAAVRTRLWDKLAPHIGEAKVVLLSPDDFLARIPWAALPGNKPGTYLIEDVALALVPIPRLLPEVLQPGQGDEAPSLLLVGGADFDGEPGKVDDQLSFSRSAPRDGPSAGPVKWNFLPGTIKEVEAIEKIFRVQHPQGALRAFTGKESTEENVRAQAPKHRYLHFATHGYFAPAEGRDDRLLSGLVLAGANRPGKEGQDDGILTALEFEALDLSGTEMAALSACETVLGKTAGGGEGLLGLQRAFQIAGAKTVVASLWQVPDRATQALMGRFYANLWEKKMSKLEALREAQIWLLREGRRQPEILRGLDILPDAADDGRLPPRYWAAFVLSGNWQ